MLQEMQIQATALATVLEQLVEYHLMVLQTSTYWVLIHQEHKILTASQTLTNKTILR